MGSIVERGSLVVSISSSGKAPVLVRQLRETNLEEVEVEENIDSISSNWDEV